jgi:hypothetical protein
MILQSGKNVKKRQILQILLLLVLSVSDYPIRYKEKMSAARVNK